MRAVLQERNGAFQKLVYAADIGFNRPHVLCVLMSKLIDEPGYSCLLLAPCVLHTAFGGEPSSTGTQIV